MLDARATPHLYRKLLPLKCRKRIFYSEFLPEVATAKMVQKNLVVVVGVQLES
jgi:hypothetical protein